MTRSPRLPRAALGALMLSSACAPEDAGPTLLEATSASGLYEVSLAFAGPVRVGDVAADLGLADALGPLAGAAVELDATMASHGHGLAEPPDVTDLGGGAYAAAWVFPMAGAWELTVSITAGDGADAAVVDVDVE